MAEETKYYLDDNGGLWKSESNSHYYFLRTRLEWIKSKACFFGYATYMLNPLKNEEATKILSDFGIEGKLEKDTLPFQYQYYEHEGEFFAEDIYGNEYHVLSDMTLKTTPKGTIKADWKGFHVEYAKSRIIGSIFEIRHRYTKSDEDYEFDIRVYKDGSVFVGQSASYCYRPRDKNIELEKSENFKTEIINLLQDYKSEIDMLEYGKEKAPHDIWGYVGKIYDKEFALPSGSTGHFVQEIANEIIEKIEEFYPNHVDWNVSIKRN